MEINIPKIYKPEFNDVIDHIEEMIFEKIKLKTVATGGFDVYCLNIEKINCKIIGIEYEERKKIMLNMREKDFNKEYKRKQLSKIPDLKNIKYIIISDILFDIYHIIDEIFHECNFPKVNFSNYEAYNCIKNNDFQSVTLDKFDIKFYLNEIYDEISRRYSLCSYDTKKLCTMFESDFKKVDTSYKSYYDFVSKYENKKNLQKFNETLTKNINYKSFIDQLSD